MDKIVKESLSEDLQEGLKVDGITYNNVHTPQGRVFVGHDGILAHNRVLIPWDTIRRLMSKYSKS